MKQTVTELQINGVTYVPKTDNVTPAQQVDGMPYVLVRTYSAGVFAGYLKQRDGKEVVLLNARRIWYWAGAASLSQLAVDGTSKPNQCKFPCEVPSVTLLETIEILSVSAQAKKTFESVPVWKQ